MIHRQTITKLCNLTGLVYEQSTDPEYPDWFMWDIRPSDGPEWLTPCFNCSHPDEVYRWVLEKSAVDKRVHDAMKEAGMRPRRLQTVEEEAYQAAMNAEVK